MRYLSLAEVLDLHRRIIAVSGGGSGVRDISVLESAVAQPRMTFDKQDLYPDAVSKAAALCYSLVLNHPFMDGNKRVILALAAGGLSREVLTLWLKEHATQCTT